MSFENSTVIRKAVATDAAALRRVRLEALQNHPEVYGADYATEQTYPDSFWEQTLTDEAERAVFIVEVHSETVGMSVISFNRAANMRHNAFIQAVYLRQEFRGSGIARQLLAVCLEWAKQNGAAVIKLAVTTENSRAIRLYSKMGFRVYGVDPKAILYKGDFYDELLMVCEL